MKIFAWFLVVGGLLLVLPARQANAQQIVAGFGVAGGSTVIVLSGGTLSKFLTEHDRLFVSLGIEREFFRQNDPLNQANALLPLVVEAQRFQIEEAELDQAIRRLGRLIREAEKERAR